ncbi:MAG: DUF4349 domain-containing protein [Actinomycetota bacterium]|nr:DUF4349 domain-containing protein [Actinomycetota bacterium]
MRQLDEFPLDPEIAAQLDAIDATLAGEPVDPEYAELAELALLVTVARPQIATEFAATLDERVSRRFAPAPASGSGVAGRSRRRSIRLWPAAGAFATAVAGVIIAVVVLSSGGPKRQDLSLTPLRESATSAASSAAPATSSSAGSAGASSAGSGSASSAASIPPTKAAPQSNLGAITNGAASRTAAVQPPANGRKIVQSAQLQLTAPPARIDQVAQEAFNVVGAESGIVNHSAVTATGGSDGYAEFDLSVPSAKLADTMTRLTSLRYANVASRTDASQDVNNQYVSDVRRLADARALRTSLLKQLAKALTQVQIDSLKTQIRDAEASISRAEATLGSLQHRIGFSQISLTINAGAVPAPDKSQGGFTIGKAAHDAGRVLTVAAGVALIALAALVPVGLVAALALWIGLTLRRRRREHALDAA